MPLTIPTLDDSKYQDIRAEALARVPVHTPEWTNFNESDPGVTLIEVFSFLHENLLYVANQIPERNRLKFLTLLGVPLRPASPAIGLAQVTNARGPLQRLTLDGGVEASAGSVPFRLELGLDVLPVEARVYAKQEVELTPEAQSYYNQLYASFNEPVPAGLKFYETVPFDGTTPLDVSTSVNSQVWVALLARPNDPVDLARKQIGGAVLSLGVVPVTDSTQGRDLPPGVDSGAGSVTGTAVPIVFETAKPNSHPADWARCPDVKFTNNVLAEPGVVQVTLPAEEKLQLWDVIEPLEAGTGDFPPSIDDTDVADRVVTWLRLTFTSPVTIFWMGINTTPLSQRQHVSGELLPQGTGEPDQSANLANPSALPGSVTLSVTVNGKTQTWTAIDDLSAAPPEVAVRDPLLPPGAVVPQAESSNVFSVDYESGQIQFGDGTHGCRPPFGAVIRADYDYALGSPGNVGVGAVSTDGSLPAGFAVSNPVPTWGGVDAQSADDGQKQIPSYLQHRDRLVAAQDFHDVAMRTPGVEIARVEVLPAYNPQLGATQPGDSPGAVTLVVIPWNDPTHPDTPEPGNDFLNAICDYLAPRRLVTTELLLRGPDYVGIWVSIGIETVNGTSIADVEAAVKTAVRQALSPLPPDDSTTASGSALPRPPDAPEGWELATEVFASEITAIANRVPGVLRVNEVQLARDGQPAAASVPMGALQLPRILGIAVAIGPATDLADLQGQAAPAGGGSEPTFLPVPVAPEECD